ncbi:hypothetical protein SYNPS1DRAFT_27825, partial [Syncephalis pseudoplumigaleata]
MASTSHELQWIPLHRVKQSTAAMSSHGTVDMPQGTVAVHGVLWGILTRREISTDKPHERGRIQFADHSDTIYCHVVGGSSLWFGRPVLVTTWAYVPVETTSDVTSSSSSSSSSYNWLARLEISEVRLPPADMSDSVIKEMLLAGRLDLSSMRVLDGHPAILSTLTTEEASTLARVATGASTTAAAAATARRAISSIVGRVCGKTVVHRPPNAPTWFIVEVKPLTLSDSKQSSSHHHHRQPSISFVLFYGNALVDYYEQIWINDIVWFDRLQRPSSANAASYALHFYSERATPVLRYLSKEQVLRAVTPSDKPVDEPAAPDKIDWIVDKVIDIHLGIFELKPDRVDTLRRRDPPISCIRLFHTHDPSYYAWKAYRPGHRITIYNGHGSRALCEVNGMLIMFTCSASCVVVDDMGSEALPLPLTLSTVDAWFFRGCEQRQWNIRTTTRAYVLHQMLEWKFPHAWTTQDMLAMPPPSSSSSSSSTSSSDVSSIGMLWRFIDSCNPNASGTPPMGTRREYMEEALCHRSDCPSDRHEVDVPFALPLNMITKQLDQLDALKHGAYGPASIYYPYSMLAQQQLPSSLGTVQLVGVLDGDATGRLVLADGTYSLPVILMDHRHPVDRAGEDASEDGGDTWTCSQQRLPTHLLGHVWAISTFRIYKQHDRSSEACSAHHLPQMYIQFDLTEAVCISQGAKPTIASPSPPAASIYYFRAKSAVQYTTLCLTSESLKWLPTLMANQHYLIVNPTSSSSSTARPANKQRDRRPNKQTGAFLTLSADAWIEQVKVDATQLDKFSAIRNLSGKPLAPVHIDTQPLDDVMAGTDLATPLLTITEV